MPTLTQKARSLWKVYNACLKTKCQSRKYKKALKQYIPLQNRACDFKKVHSKKMTVDEHWDCMNKFKKTQDFYEIERAYQKCEKKHCVNAHEAIRNFYREEK